MGTLYQFKSTETDINRLALLVIVEYNENSPGVPEDYSAIIERIDKSLPSNLLFLMYSHEPIQDIQAMLKEMLRAISTENTRPYYNVVIIECLAADISNKNAQWLRENWLNLYSKPSVQKPAETYPFNLSTLQIANQPLSRRSASIFSWMENTIPPKLEHQHSDKTIEGVSL